MTLRNARADRAQLDFVRKSRDADRLTRPIDLHRKWTFVDDVRLRGGALVWRAAEPKRLGNHWIFDGEIERKAVFVRRQAEQAGRGVLDDFLLLRDCGDKAILKYAQTWGVLELCCHNLPACHEFALGVRLQLPKPIPKASKKEMRRMFDQDRRQCPPLGTEPLSTWRFFAAQASALLRVSANLARGVLGEESDWAILLREKIKPILSLQAQRRCVRDVIEDWLRLGRIKPTIDDLSGRLTWTGADLFGEIAVQLALAVEECEGQISCIVCGKPYAPKRRVIRRGFNYCPAGRCQREAAAQRAKRYRDRKRSSGNGSVRNLTYRGPYGGRTNDPFFAE